MSNDAPDSSATPDTGELHNPLTSTAADHDDAPDTDAELLRWKSSSRKWEDRAKANADAAKELATHRAATMTELEKAVAETKSATRSEVLREVGASRAADHVRIAAAGRPIDVDALLEGLNLERFVDDEGQPDTKAISAYVDRIAPEPAAEEPRNPRVPTGHRGPVTALNDDNSLIRDIKTALRM